MTTKTERFASELSTACTIQRVVLHAKGVGIDAVKAHEIWAEHSEDYCAQWLCWRDSDPTNEILQALTKYEGRHGPLPRVQLPLKVADMGRSNTKISNPAKE